MTFNECCTALGQVNVGRLACAHEGQPYAIPINFAFDGTYLYGFTTLGQKVEWMRANPLLCLEVDKVISENEWMSIVVFGKYQELPDLPKYEHARKRALSFSTEAGSMVGAALHFSETSRATSLVDTNLLSDTHQEDHRA